MFGTLKSVATGALSVAALAMAVPAQARDGYYDRRGDGDDAALAIGAGVIGLALGAAIASSGRDRDRYYHDDGYYYPRGNYYNSYPRYYRNHDYRYPRNYRRGGDGWRGDRRGHHNGRGNGWGHRDRRWGY